MRVYGIVLPFLLLAASPLEGQWWRRPIILPPPAEEETEILRDLVYKTVPDQQLRMDVYRPAASFRRPSRSTRTFAS